MAILRVTAQINRRPRLVDGRVPTVWREPGSGCQMIETDFVHAATLFEHHDDIDWWLQLGAFQETMRVWWSRVD